MKFLSLILLIVISTSCSTTRDGGSVAFEHVYYESLTGQEKPIYAQSVVLKETRDPKEVKLEEFRTSPEGKIQKIGLVLFETVIRPTITGLSSDQSVYLSLLGKQKLTDLMHQFWVKELKLKLGKVGVELISPATLKASKEFRAYGSPVENLYQGKIQDLNSEDIFYLPPGKKLEIDSLELPRSMQNVSLLLIPATEMMFGPKPTEHQALWVNGLCRELGLDAVIVVGTWASWVRGGIDKRTKEEIKEEMTLKMGASILYPYQTYFTLGERKGNGDLRKENIPLATYSVKVQSPVKISVEEAQENFQTIQTNLLDTFWKQFSGVSDLVMERIVTDVKETL